MSPNTLNIDPITMDNFMAHRCQEFIDGNGPRFILGTNNYAAAIAKHVDVDGFIDEIYPRTEFLGKPVYKLNQISNGAYVLSAVVLAKPQQVMKKLSDCGMKGIDYYSFQKYSGINLEDVIFNYDTDFRQEYLSHIDWYNELYEKLADDVSKEVMQKIFNFRLSSDLKHLQGFEYNPQKQYFEEFLELKPSRESFFDVGCFDGATSLEFIKKCPQYRAIHLFEPESENMKTIEENLSNFSNIYYHDFGLADREMKLKFSSDGPASRISEEGDYEIGVKPLDTVKMEDATFIKMDIEGGEVAALKGATNTIVKFHPRLAICVYHKPDDFRTIPQLVLSMRSDYDIYLRHYTEGVTETVMFFVPVNRNVEN